MKKRILSVVFAVMMIICLVGCGITHQQATGQTESNSSGDFGNGYFTVITEWDSYQIVYANEIKEETKNFATYIITTVCHMIIDSENWT